MRQSGGFVTAETAGVLLTTLDLSPTHHLEFAYYPDGKELNVREWFNADRDSAEDSMRAKVPAGASMTDTYVIMAGDNVDAAVEESLRTLEQELKLHPEAPAPYVEPVSTLDAVQGGDSDDAVSGENLGVVQQASCNDGRPPAIPTTDAAWFKKNFCPAGNEFCKTDQFTPSHRGERRTKQTDQNFFNQGSCRNSNFVIKKDYNCIWDIFGCIGCTMTRQQGEVEPRFVFGTNWWSNSTDVCGDWPTWSASGSGFSDTGLMHDIH